VTDPLPPGGTTIRWRDIPDGRRHPTPDPGEVTVLGAHQLHGRTGGGGYQCLCGTPLTLGAHPTHVATMLAGARTQAGRGVVDETELCEILRGVITALDTSLVPDRP
jgi:hypothetical protein